MVVDGCKEDFCVQLLPRAHKLVLPIVIIMFVFTLTLIVSIFTIFTIIFVFVSIFAFVVVFVFLFHLVSIFFFCSQYGAVLASHHVSSTPAEDGCVDNPP
ncbi:hypothetical protein V6Z12_D07G193400 [Gossypium hirsutum]